MPVLCACGGHTKKPLFCQVKTLDSENFGTEISVKWKHLTATTNKCKGGILDSRFSVCKVELLDKKFSSVTVKFFWLTAPKNTSVKGKHLTGVFYIFFLLTNGGAEPMWYIYS